jgi:cell wall-associated NlpC family hydrolase
MMWDELNLDIAHNSRRYGTSESTRTLSFKTRLNNMLATAFSAFVFASASASVHAETPDVDASKHTVTGVIEAGEPASLDGAVLNYDPVSLQDAARKTQELARNSVGNGDRVSGVLEEAETMIGIRYLWGGNTPEEGLDCSGFVRYVYEKAAGILLPRLSAQISRKGKPIAQTDLHPGDLVFFNTPRGEATHVGIYVGEHQFIHAPKTGAFIRIESMRSAYWTSRYYGARRMVA